VIENIHSTIQGVITFTWPTIIICLVIIISTRLAYLIKTKEKIVLYKEIMMLCFIVYILCLFQVVTFQDDVSWSSNNFIPFREIMRYNITSRLFLKNVLGNMIMFLPYGFFVSFYLRSSKGYSTIILTVIASIAIELVQMSIGRVFDVDDILLNIIGGLLGYFIYSVLARIGNLFPKFFHNEIVLDIILVIVLLSGLGCLWLILL